MQKTHREERRQGSASHCPFPTPPTPPSFPRSKLKCLHGSKGAEKGGERGFKICAATRSCNDKKKKSPATGEQFHMRTHIITTHQFLKHASFCLSLGAISLFFGFLCLLFGIGTCPRKSPVAAPPSCSPFSGDCPREREKERGREREEERVGQKTQKRERFRDGKGEEGGGRRR